MGWRDFQPAYPPVHYVHEVHLVDKNGGNLTLSEHGIQEEKLDIFASGAKENPRLDLLTEVELEAFNGWYATCRKPKFNLSHEEATLTSWRLLIESMESMCRDSRGRYKKI